MFKIKLVSILGSYIMSRVMSDKYDESVYDEPQCEEIYSSDNDDRYGITRYNDECHTINDWEKEWPNNKVSDLIYKDRGDR
jgi:hypothetical protein